MRAIRRFDVFAEYSRQERLDKGYGEDEAKGYGIWLAKVVATRRFEKTSTSTDTRKPSAHKEDPGAEPRFRSVGDDLQTDEIFKHDIIERIMGMHRFTGFRVLQPPSLTNQYAAMPSLHVGWNLLMGFAMVRCSTRRWPNASGMLMP